MSNKNSNNNASSDDEHQERKKPSERHWLIRPFASVWGFMKKQRKVDAFRFHTVIALLLFSSLGLGIFFTGVTTQSREYQEVAALPKATLTEFQQALEQKKVRSVIEHELSDGTIMKPSLTRVSEIVLADGSRKTINSKLLANETVQKAIYERALKDNIDFKKGKQHGGASNRFLDFLSMIMTLACMVMVLFLFQRGMGDFLTGKNFNPKVSNENIDFSDIVGYEDVKREFREVVNQMKKSKSFAKQGIKAPKGILLTGSPGVGKTMFAKALANECGANFMYATGSDFVELYVGVGAKRARGMFAQARMNSPTVIFIDEIDALGARDAYGMDSERLATINQMLAEMDGFSENDQVLVVGATNYPDKLDAAMMRPGRFDKKISIPQPDAPTREGILKRYLKDVTVAEDLDYQGLALRSAGMSGAELKNWVSEAKNLALRESDGVSFIVDKSKMDQAQEILLLGFSERQGNAKERERVAVHELGHALIGHLLCPSLEVDKVALTGRGGALGFTMNRPLEEKSLYLESELKGQIAALLGGRAAEQVYFGEVSSGAGDDLMRVNDIARKMVCDLGMGPGSPLQTFKVNTAAGQSVPEKAQEDIALILSAQYELAIALLTEHREWLEDAKARLMKRGSLDNAALFEGLEIPAARRLH